MPAEPESLVSEPEETDGLRTVRGRGFRFQVPVAAEVRVRHTPEGTTIEVEGPWLQAACPDGTTVMNGIAFMTYVSVRQVPGLRSAEEWAREHVFPYNTPAPRLVPTRIAGMPAWRLESGPLDSPQAGYVMNRGDLLAHLGFFTTGPNADTAFEILHRAVIPLILSTFRWE